MPDDKKIRETIRKLEERLDFLLVIGDDPFDLGPNRPEHWPTVASTEAEIEELEAKLS